MDESRELSENLEMALAGILESSKCGYKENALELGLP